MASGQVARSWQRAGKLDGSPSEALRRLERLADQTAAGQPVVSHGDYALPNVLLSDSDGVGFVDVGRAGLGDRHSDLADLVRSLRSHLNPQYGEAHVQLFLDSYGRDFVDKERLALYDLVEDFFWPVSGCG